MITKTQKMVRSANIRYELDSLRRNSKRPLDSRNAVKSIHKKYAVYPVQAIWGIISNETTRKINPLIWTVKKPGGKSYFI